MVMARRKTAPARRPAAALDFTLPEDIIVDIVGRVASSSNHPMDDLHNLRATCKTMFKAAKDRYVGKRVALRREKEMRWKENERYLAVVDHLARAGNPEACFVVGLKLVLFAKQDVRRGLAWLGGAADGGHKAAAYVLGLFLYRDFDDDEARDFANAKHYIAQAEGDPAATTCETAAKATNRECKRCRKIAVDAVREAAWEMAAVVDGPRGRGLVLPADAHRCKGTASCGVTQGWGNYETFCSGGCRIRHEYTKFFTEVLRLCDQLAIFV